MQLPHNIERSGFRRGEYVAYCFGTQRVIRDGSVWRTAGLVSLQGQPIYRAAPTLRELGALLDRAANT